MNQPVSINDSNLTSEDILKLLTPDPRKPYVSPSTPMLNELLKARGQKVNRANRRVLKRAATAQLKRRQREINAILRSQLATDQSNSNATPTETIPA